MPDGQTDRQTDRRTDKVTPWAPVGAKKFSWIPVPSLKSESLNKSKFLSACESNCAANVWMSYNFDCSDAGMRCHWASKILRNGNVQHDTSYRIVHSMVHTTYILTHGNYFIKRTISYPYIKWSRRSILGSDGMMTNWRTDWIVNNDVWLTADWLLTDDRNDDIIKSKNVSLLFWRDDVDVFAHSLSLYLYFLRNHSFIKEE